MNFRKIGLVILFPYLQACIPMEGNNKSAVRTFGELSSVDFVSFSKFKNAENNQPKKDQIKIYPYRSNINDVQPQLSLNYYYSFVREELDPDGWGWTPNGRNCNSYVLDGTAQNLLESLQGIKFQPYDTGDLHRYVWDGPGPDLWVQYLDGKREGIYFSDSWAPTGDLVALPSQALEVLKAELDKMVTSGCEYPAL